MRILSARIFLSLLAGKLNSVKPMLTRKQLLRKKIDMLLSRKKMDLATYLFNIFEWKGFFVLLKLDSPKVNVRAAIVCN